MNLSTCGILLSYVFWAEMYVFSQYLIPADIFCNVGKRITRIDVRMSLGPVYNGINQIKHINLTIGRIEKDIFCSQ